jgi:hypothetical protein
MLKVGVIVRRTCRQCRKEFEFGYRRGRPRERCFNCQPLGTRVVKAVKTSHTFFGGVLMVLVALALTSLARRLLFLSHAGRESKVEQGISDHGVPGDAACASSRQQTIRLIGNRYVS